MTEEHTIDGYLGSGYQLKVLWQILTEPDFGNKIFPFLKTEYFDDPNHRRFFTVLREYFNEYGKTPNLQNKSIFHAITKFKQVSNPVDEEILLGIAQNIKNWNDRVLNKNLDYDGDTVQKSVYNFIKQGEYHELAAFIMSNIKHGLTDEINYKIDQKTKRISDIGSDEDEGIEIFHDIERALQVNFREPIGTGILAIDNLMGGGLGKGEIGIILAGTGVGKSTALTKIANEAHSLGKNVLHVVFEDTEDEIRRKHFAIWSDTKLSEMNDNLESVGRRVKDYQNNGNLGKLIIKKFPQEGITIPKIRQWMDRYKKKWGISFNLLALDYIDCVEPHEKYFDQNKAEEGIIKAFEGIASDYNIPCWTAIQANRSGLGSNSNDGSASEFIGTAQMGGSIKRAQKTHFLMSVAKTSEQKRAGLANIAILKARFAADGQKFEDAIFDNDSVKIVVRDSDYSYRNKKGDYEDDEPNIATDGQIDKLSEKIAAMNRNMDANKEGRDLVNYKDTISGDTATNQAEEKEVSELPKKEVEVKPIVNEVFNEEQKKNINILQDNMRDEFAKMKNLSKFVISSESESDIRKQLNEMSSKNSSNIKK
jgi:replicative DNA helicase